MLDAGTKSQLKSYLDRITQPVQRSHAWISPPREYELRGAAGANELVVNQIGRHPHERQVPPSLADDFMGGRERYQVREAFHGDDVAVMDGVRDGVLKTSEH